MVRPFVLAFLLASMTSATQAADVAQKHRRFRIPHESLEHTPTSSALVGGTKAEVDTTFLLGGPGRHDGRFETPGGAPSWQGWTTQDLTVDGTYAWQISAERVLAGTRSMVCGADFVYGDGSVDFGYGNGWHKYLVFTHEVQDPGQSVVIRLTGLMRYDTEPGFDFVYLEVETAAGWIQFSPETVWTGEPPPEPIVLDESVTLLPEDFGGDDGDQVAIRFAFVANPVWSDADQNWDTDGPCWLDDLEVFLDGVSVDFEDFEDGVSDRWTEVLVGGVGDFTQIYPGLQDADPCFGNSSYQVAFIDDGVVVPGTGGSPCVTWCYGPGGYVVNHTGGLLGPDYHLANTINSPPLAWPAGDDAMGLAVSYYRHYTDAGVGWYYQVRSTTGEDPADLDGVAWRNPGWGLTGDIRGRYSDISFDLTDLLEPGAHWVQVGIVVEEFGWIWGDEGDDGTPAPYFDNVRVYTYPYAGPSIGATYVRAQDNFPEQGDLDLTDLASNHIRFDLPFSISAPGDLRNDPGDSLTIGVTLPRAGASMPQLPQMVVRMRANPLFDGVRSLPPGFSQTGAIVTGVVTGDSIIYDGILLEDKYSFDLPDTGFFYPGDVIHYYFEAWDEVAGDVGHAMLPGDTAGFASFTHDLSYPDEFICRGLPTLHSTTPGDQPKILFWNEAGPTTTDEWYFALGAAGLREQEEYDVFESFYYSLYGAGLGSRATAAVLDGYDVLLYSCSFTTGISLGNGDYGSAPSRDIQLLDAWFNRGGKHAFMTGDNLVYDLTESGAEAAALLNAYIGVQFVDANVRSFIGEQSAPLVRTLDGNGVIVEADRWIAYGGCPISNRFDAITTTGASLRLAEFTGPAGESGLYPYAAGVYHYNANTDTEVVLLPYGLGFVHNAPGWTPPEYLGAVAARAVILRDVLYGFDQQLEAPIGVDDVPPPGELVVSSYPNPFNPLTTIALSLPRAGQVGVKIYDLRGRLVRTLHDGLLAAGRHELVWDGRDDAGAPGASGVYFAETRALDQVRVNRLALIK